MLNKLSPSSAFSVAHDWPFRIVKEREANMPDLKPPRYFEELIIPFPETMDELELVLTDSPASLMLLRCPESENSLSDT